MNKSMESIEDTLERTFILIKPANIGDADAILDELDHYGHRVASAHVDAIPRDIIESHYAPHKGKFYFEDMVADFVEKPTVIAVYEGAGVISRMLEIIGPTDPSKAPPHTIRYRYSNDSLADAIAQKRPLKNVVHRSDSVSESSREIAVWNQYLQL